MAKQKVSNEDIVLHMVLLMDTSIADGQAKKLADAKEEAANREAGYYDNWMEAARMIARAEQYPLQRFNEVYGRAKKECTGTIHPSAKTAASVIRKAFTNGVSLYAGKKLVSFGTLRARVNAVTAKDCAVTVEQANACKTTAEARELRRARSETKNTVGQPERNAPRLPEAVGERVLELKRQLQGMTEADATAFLDRMLAEAAGGNLPDQPEPKGEAMEA